MAKLSSRILLWIFRLRVLHRIDSIVLLLPNTPTTTENDRGRRMNQRCTVMTKTCFTFQPECLSPNSCATNDARQMRMTDEDTPHSHQPTWLDHCPIIHVIKELRKVQAHHHQIATKSLVWPIVRNLLATCGLGCFPHSFHQYHRGQQ